VRKKPNGYFFFGTKKTAINFVKQKEKHQFLMVFQIEGWVGAVFRKKNIHFRRKWLFF